MRELSDVNQLRDATETATDRLVRPQRRRTSCTPTPPLGPESVSVQGRACRASKSTWPPKSSSAASRVGSLGPLSTQYALATIKLSALVENLPSKQPGSDATAYLTCYLRLLPDVDMKNSSTVDGVCANSSKVDCARAYIPTHDLDKATRQELESYRTDGAEPYHPAPLSNSGGYGKCRNI